ncbi:MAG TPA: hypothetical protein V6D06_00050 [Trichocoleus sp.]
MPPQFTMQITYRITLGSHSFSADRGSPLLDLRVESSLTVPVNEAVLTLNAVEPIPLKLGDPVTVDLGYGKNLARVYSGTLSAITRGIDRVCIESHSRFRGLAQAHFNLLYEKSTAGDIVKDLAQRLKLTVGTVESGLKFPAYALGDHRSAYAEARSLADLCGFDLYANPQDQVVFAPYKSGTPQECRYGTDLLAYHRTAQPPLPDGLEVYGESPASQGQGEQAASWLTKEEVRGRAGKTAGVVVRRAEPTARSQNLADQIAKALFKAQAKQQQGWVRILGNPQVTLGGALKITQMPLTADNGTFKVTGLRHQISRRQGFCTTVNWEGS